MMDTHAASYYDYMHLVPFSLHGEEFALELHDVVEVANLSPIKKVPHFSEGIKGLMELHGEELTVFDVREKLGLPQRALDWKAKVIVCPHGNGRVGMIVEKVYPIIEVKKSSLEQVPPHVHHKIKEGVSGVVTIDGKRVIILDASLLLCKEEMHVHEKPFDKEWIRHEQGERLHRRLLEAIENAEPSPKRERSRILLDVDEAKKFYLHDGGSFRSLYGLIDALKSMDEATFRHHVTPDRNDFANWVKDGVGDGALGDILMPLKTKDEIALEVIKRVLHLEIVEEEE